MAEIATSYPAILNNAINGEFFTGLSDDKKPLFVESLRRNFISENGIKEEEDLKYINDESKSIYDEYRNDLNIPRFTPNSEQAKSLYGQPIVDTSKPIDEQIKSVELWRDTAKVNSAKLLPANKEDLDFHVEDLANNYIRNIEGANSYKPGGMPDWLTDKTKRFIESGVKGFGIDLLFPTQDANRFFAKNLVENPEFDGHVSSDLAGGFGQMLSQVAISAGLTMSGHPELAGPALLSLSGARYMTEAYNAEIKRTGNELQAIDAAVASLPASVLDAGPDIFLGGILNRSAGFAEKFVKATTTEAKREVLRAAIPSIKKEIITQGLSEGIIGGAAADVASNLGNYYATGDEKYLKNATDIQALAYSAFIEGTVGAVMGGGLSALSKGGAQDSAARTLQQLTRQQVKQSEIYTALKAKDYGKVVDMVANKTISADELEEHKKQFDKAQEEARKVEEMPEGPLKDQAKAEFEKQNRNVPNNTIETQRSKWYALNINKKIEEYTQQDPVANKAKIDKLTEALAKFHDGTNFIPFQEETEFNANIQLDSSIPKRTKSEDDVTIEGEKGDEKITDDNVIYLNLKKGELLKHTNLDKVVNKKDLKVLVGPKEIQIGGKKYNYNVNAKEGLTPVVIGNNKIKILAPVKSVTKKTVTTPAATATVVTPTNDGALTPEEQNRYVELANKIAKQTATPEEQNEFIPLKRRYNAMPSDVQTSPVENEVIPLNDIEEKQFEDLLALKVQNKITPDQLKIYEELEPRSKQYRVAQAAQPAVYKDGEVVNNDITKEEPVIQQEISQESIDILAPKLGVEPPVVTTKRKRTKEPKPKPVEKPKQKKGKKNATPAPAVEEVKETPKEKEVEVVETLEEAEKKAEKERQPIDEINLLEEVIAHHKKVIENEENEPANRVEWSKNVLPDHVARLEALKAQQPIQNIVEQPTKEPTLNELNSTRADLSSKVRERTATPEEKKRLEEVIGLINKLQNKEKKEKSDNEIVTDYINKKVFQQSKNTTENKVRRESQKEAINKIAENLGISNDIVIKNNLEELEKTDKELADQILKESEISGIKGGGVVQGFVENGKAYILLDHIIPHNGETFELAAERIFKHEVVGHLGVDQVLEGINPEGFKKLVTFLKGLEIDGVNVWNDRAGIYKGESDKNIVREIFAKRAEKSQEWYDKIIKKVVNYLKRIKFLAEGKGDWTLDDIDAMIRAGLDAIKSKNGKSEIAFSKNIDSVRLNSSLKGMYGAWIAPNGKIHKVNKMDHFGVAFEILGDDFTGSVDDVYREMGRRGYVKATNLPQGVWIEGNPNSSQRAIIDFIGINDEKKITLNDNKVIYRPPSKETIRFSKQDYQPENKDITIKDSSFNQSGVNYEQTTLTHTPTNSTVKFSIYKNPTTQTPENIKISRADTPEENRRKGGASVLIEELKNIARKLNLPIYSGFSNEQSKPMLEKLGFRKALDIYDLPIEDRFTDKSKQHQKEQYADYVWEPSSEIRFSKQDRPTNEFKFRLEDNLNFPGLVVANDETVPTQNLTAKIRKDGATKFEVETLNKLAEGLSKNGRINIEEFNNVIKEQPTVVVSELSISPTNPKVQKVRAIQHEFESTKYSISFVGNDIKKVMVMNDRFEEVDPKELPENLQKLYNEAININITSDDFKGGSGSQAATGKYGVEPYTNDYLKGEETLQDGKQKAVWAGDLSLNVPVFSKEQEKQNELTGIGDFYKNPKFTSQHYSGEVADNQLAFVRGVIHEYSEGAKLPNGSTAKGGERVFEVFELQSDWANQESKNNYIVKAETKNLVNPVYDVINTRSGTVEASYTDKKLADEKSKDLNKNKLTEPLLEYYETLGLKAAVNFASRNGVDNIVISDAESAMLNEGHDQYAEVVVLPTKENKDKIIDAQTKGEITRSADSVYSKLVDGEKITLSDHIVKKLGLKSTGENIIKQEKGMRAAYDERAPNIMQKLTGQKPVKADMGVHNKVLSDRINSPWEELSEHPTSKEARAEYRRLAEADPANEYSMNEKVVDGKQVWVVTKANVGSITPNVFNRTQNTGRMFPIAKANKDIRFSKQDNPQSEESDKQVEEVEEVEEEPVQEDDADYISFGDGELISQSKSEASKAIGKLFKKKIEQKLIIKEVDVLNGFKDIPYAYLDDADIESMLTDLDNFISTRTRQQEPSTDRTDVDTLLNKIAVYKNKANRAEYDYWKSKIEKLPPFEDFKGDIGAVRAFVWQALDESPETSNVLFTDEDIEYLDAIEEMQFDIMERADEQEDIINRYFADAANLLTPVGDKHLDGLRGLSHDQIMNIKKIYTQYILSLITTDPANLTRPERRKLYYQLLSVSTDGYPNGINKFITNDLTNLLKLADQTFINPYATKGKAVAAYIESIPTQILRVAPNSTSADLLYRLQVPLREGLRLAKRAHEQYITPYMEGKLKEIYNGVLDADKANQIGMFMHLRQHPITESLAQSLKHNVNWLLKSNRNLKIYDKSFLNQGERHDEYLLKEFLGNIPYELKDGQIVNDFTDEDVRVFLENANHLIGEKGIKYADSVVELFNAIKPLAKVTSEFIYGRTFDEIANYVPSMSVIVKGDGKFEPDMSRYQLMTDNKSFTQDSNNNYINTTGGGTTMERTRNVGENRTLVLNPNNLADSVGRLAVYDYFTAHARQEMKQFITPNTKVNRLFMKFLGDESHGNVNNLGRFQYIAKAMNSLWQNELSQVSYFHPFHQSVNWFAKKWAQGRLSGAHQFFAQSASNTIPYFVQHINSPRKAANWVGAMGYWLKYKTGQLEPHQEKLVENVLFEVRHRQQEMYLDKSINLNINPSSTVEWFKANMPAVFKGVRLADKVIEKALMYPFKISDIISGTPMMLAEYLNQEQDRLGTHVRFEDLVYNPKSYLKAVDDVERYIGIGDASRRGEALTNRNAGISTSRNLLMAFRSFTLNNAMNFAADFRKVTNSDVSPELKAKSLRYMAGIISQSIVYSGVKVAIMGMVAKAIIHSIKHPEEDEELKRLYRKAQGKLTEKERRALDAEITMRQQIKKAIGKVDERNGNNRILMISAAQDVLPNMFYGLNIDLIPDLAIHILSDESEERSFKDWKTGEQERLEKLIKRNKALGNTGTTANLMEELASVNMQEFLPAVYTNRSITTLGGSFGGTAKGIEDMTKSMSKYFYEPQAIGANDFLNMASVLGVSQPDIKRFFKAQDEIQKAERTRDEKLTKK